MAVRHYAYQYKMRTTEEKITDGNVSSENSDIEDYYPLMYHGTIINARSRQKQIHLEEMVRLLIFY